MRDRLKSLWKPSGGFDILDLGHGFFLVKFDEKGDRMKVIKRGPWMLFDHYLSVSIWSLNFVSSSTKIEKTLAWVRIPCLNVRYYDENVLFTLAGQVCSYVSRLI